MPEVAEIRTSAAACRRAASPPSQPVLAVGEDADVAAHADRHAGLHRELEGAAVLLDALGRGFLAVPVLEIARIGLRRGERRAERDAFVVHQLEYLRRAAIAVLDRVGSGEDRAAHAFGGGRVDGDEAAGVVSGGDAGVELGLREGGRDGSPWPQ